jgi:hypothetical protein
VNPAGSRTLIHLMLLFPQLLTSIGFPLPFQQSRDPFRLGMRGLIGHPGLFHLLIRDQHVPPGGIQFFGSRSDMVQDPLEQRCLSGPSHRGCAFLSGLFERRFELSFPLPCQFAYGRSPR